MNNYIELFINNPVNAKLDIGEFDIALKYSIADIRDISKRNSSYSKTITLPGTKNNNFWLGNLFDVNTDFTTFNPNVKTPAKLLLNGETIIDGFFQLRKIRKVNTADFQGNEILYEIVMFNNAVDLMTELGEKTIDKLNLSEFGHTFSYDNVTASWNHDYTDGYVYPMYGYEDTAANFYNIDNFWPGMFYWTLLDRTLQEAGFGWTGSLKTNEQFKKEIITYVSDGRPKISEEERRRREFYVGATSSLLIGTFSGSNNQSLTQSAPFVNENLPYFDNDNNWNTTTYQWELDTNGIFSGEWKLQGTFSLFNATGATVSAIYPGGTTLSNNTRRIGYVLYSRVKIVRNNNTIETWDGNQIKGFHWTFTNFVGNEVQSSTFSIAETKDVGTFDFTDILTTLTSDTNPSRLSIGDRVYLEVELRRINAGSSLFVGNSVFQTTSLTYWNGSLQAILSFNDNSFFRNTAITSELTQGDYIDLAEYLPDKIKQKDLITDLITRYNLYITIDPSNDRLLIMDSRPDYYNKGETLDWTEKKDYSFEDNIELLSELQFKEMKFTWTQDEDEPNKGYEFATGDVFGEYNYIFDNDFVKGTKQIKSPFSPTIVVYNDFIGAHLPAIDPIAPKIKPRVLLWGGLRTSNNWILTYQNISTGLVQTTTLNQYPYAGHWDDPIEPTYDSNFYTAKFYGYNNYEYLTNNNMFNQYWSNYMKQIEQGRLVTSKFYLTEADIRYIRNNFNSKIFILDSYYYINAIKDYKPITNEPTIVELIKIVDGVTWEGQTFGQSPGLTAIGPVGPAVDPVGPIRPVRPIRPFRDWGFKNSVGDGGLILGGSKNNLGGVYYTDEIKVASSQIAFGDNNTITNDRSGVLFGDDNIIEGSNNLLFNSDDTTITGDNVTAFNVTGLTISDSNLVYLGPSFSVSTIDGTIFINGATFTGGGTGGGVNGTGTTNTITKWTSPTTISDSNITDNNSSVSVGITASFNGAVNLNNTNGGSQFWDLSIPSSGTGQVGRKAPNKFNGLLSGSSIINIDPDTGHYSYLVSSTASNREVNLPTIGYLEWSFLIVDRAGVAGSNPLRINAASGELINGTSSIWIDNDRGAIQVYSDGVEWFVMSNSYNAFSGTSSTSGGTGGSSYLYYTEPGVNQAQIDTLSPSGQIELINGDSAIGLYPTNVAISRGLTSSINIDDTGIQITNEVDLSSNKITNLANGTTASDAINLGQLNSTISNVIKSGQIEVADWALSGGTYKAVVTYSVAFSSKSRVVITGGDLRSWTVDPGASSFEVDSNSGIVPTLPTYWIATNAGS